jgi:hypothetical protein
MKRLAALVFCGTALTGLAAPAHAGTIGLNFNAGTTQVVTAFSNFWAYGDSMDGMLVTVTSAAGATTQASWADFASPECGGASTDGWSLFVCDDPFNVLQNDADDTNDQFNDTFYGQWTLNAETPISRVVIDALSGFVAFDVFEDVEHTPGSSIGRVFEVLNYNPQAPDILATFIDLVAVTGESPKNDLYRHLQIDFSTPFSGQLKFFQDTDMLIENRNLNPVPEPASLLLLGTGLLAAARSRRRSP